jgi:hypothetical protein
MEGNTADERVQLSLRVVEAVADRKGVSAQDLSPLFRIVDPDALDALFSAWSRTADQTGHVQFEYEGHTVIVDSSGRVGVSKTGD